MTAMLPDDRQLMVERASKFRSKINDEARLIGRARQLAAEDSEKRDRMKARWAREDSERRARMKGRWR
jgi:hypothetical protein